GFQFFNLSVCDLVCVRTFCQSLFQSIQISLNSSLVIGVNLVPCFFHGFLCLEYHSICIIFCINSLFTFLILCLILSSFSYSLVDLVIGHVRACCDRDMLLFSCSQVFCRNVNNTVCINIKGNFDLRNPSSCWRDSIQTELSKGLIVSRKLSLTLYYVDINGSLIIRCCGEDLALLCRNSCISLDQSGSDTSHGLDRQ